MTYELAHIRYSWKAVAAISAGLTVLLIAGTLLFFLQMSIIDPISLSLAHLPGGAAERGLASIFYGINDIIIYLIIFIFPGVLLAVFVAIFLVLTAMVFLYNFFAGFLGGVKMEIQRPQRT